MKKIYLIVLLLSACLTDKNAIAQDERPDEKPQYIVEIDSQFIKATPYEITYENGREIHHDENVEWYTDMTIRSFLPRKVVENRTARVGGDTYPTIFLLSGGGFVKWDNQNELNPDFGSLNANLKLASKLANEGYNVFWIDYDLETTSAYKDKIDSLFKKPTGSCYLGGTEAKGRMEHASLKAFRDFRVKFKNIINTPANNIDPNNVFIAGISAGAVLTIYSVFLDQSEIPSDISYVGCGGGSPTAIVSIGANHSLRKDGYPMPAIKGIIPMAGGSFYSNIFNNTTHSNNTAVNFMHGTCDELINQSEGRVSYKFFYFVTILPPVLGAEYNGSIIDRYPYVYGSKYLYNLLIATHNKIGFGQVIKGGHGIINPKSTADGGVGAWDAYQTSNITSAISLRDLIFDNISLFMKRVIGEASPAWTNHAYSVFPDVPTKYCLTDDQTLLAPPIITVDTVCGTVAATVSNPPSWTTITWTVSPNLQIVGANTGPAISYKSLSAGSGWVRASVNYGGGVVIPVTKNVLVPATCPTPCNGILYYDHQTVVVNTSIIHCGNIHSQNVKVNNGVSLILDATGYVLIPGNFEIPLGATLSINP